MACGFKICLGLGWLCAAGLTTPVFAAPKAKAAAKPLTRATVPVARRPGLPSFDEYLKILTQSKDYLGLRIVLKAYAVQPKKSKASWITTRRLLDGTPQVGQDLLLAWKYIAPYPRTATEKKFQQRWAEAQSLMLKRKFNQSATILEQLVVHARLRIERAKDKSAPSYRSDVVLYSYLLHSLARAYYGEKEFGKSLQLYDWIPSGYGPFRQVLFEKMWAAYRAGDVSRTLAAIASQKSAYFSAFLEPEAYLLQVYMYKRLCRDAELQNVLRELEVFRRQLENGKFDLAAWATWDSENLAMYKLLDPANLAPRNGVSIEDRKAEMAKIVGRLKTLYQRNVARLKQDINQVISFSGMAALSNTTRQLSPIEKLASRRDILASGYEIWPYDSGEEWIDEIGAQRYLGESRCENKK